MSTSSATWFLCALFYSLTVFGGSLGQNGADVVKVFAEEDSSAVLPCSISTKENIVAAVFDWKKDTSPSEKEVFFYQSGLHYNNGHPGQDEQFKGRVSHFQDELKNGNASIKIQNTKIEDSGNYTCIFPLSQPRQISYVQLLVEQVFKDRSGERNGAAPEPIIKLLIPTKDWWLLQCEAHGVAPLTVEWPDSANNKLQAEKPETSERGGQLYITVKITVTKTDDYRCVATQKNISHQIVTTIPVYIHEDVSTQGGNGWIGGFFTGVAVVVLPMIIPIMILIATKRIKITFNNKGPYQLGNDVESSTATSLNSAL